MTTKGDEEERKSISIQEHLTISIIQADRLIKSAQEANFTDLAHQASHLTHLLRAAVRLTAATATTLYDPPIRRITTDVSNTLRRALTLLRRCKSSTILRHVVFFSITTATDFRKLSTLLENSLADVKWLLSIFDSDSDTGTVLSLPPIASNDPILAWVWSYLASIHIGSLNNRIESCQELSALAQLSGRYKKIIMEENGVPPLLKLLKETTSPEAQIAAASALFNLADVPDRVAIIAKENGVQAIVKAMNESPPARVQVELVKLVWRMAEVDEFVKEEFGKESMARVVVTLLVLDNEDEDEDKDTAAPTRSTPRAGLRSLVEVAKERNKNGSSRSVVEKGKGKEEEFPEVKTQLRLNCAIALRKLAKGSLLNAKKIMETKALLCLAKIIEKERGELQIHGLNTVMELAAVAEDNVDLRRAAFKTNSTSVRAVLDQLLRVMNHRSSGAPLLIPAVKAIGCLARTFSAKETRVIEPLVAQLAHREEGVANQAVIALAKFVSPENFNRVDHSKAIVEFDGVARLMNLLKAGERNHIHEVLLLCYLAVHVGNNKAFEEGRVLSVLEGAARHIVVQNPGMRELFANAIHHLTLYQAAGAPAHRQVYPQA